jgi:hypothetical protein
VTIAQIFFVRNAIEERGDLFMQTPQGRLFLGRYVNVKAKYCKLYVEYDIDVDGMEESVDRCRAECLSMGPLSSGFNRPS